MTTGTECVCGSHGMKTQHKRGGAACENVTEIVTICANGTTLCLTIIFKVQNFMTKWAENNVGRPSSEVPEIPKQLQGSKICLSQPHYLKLLSYVSQLLVGDHS